MGRCRCGAPGGTNQDGKAPTTAGRTGVSTLYRAQTRHISHMTVSIGVFQAYDDHVGRADTPVM
ncbi:hypothetical protein GCM10010330_76580 [Streptomyces tendae]|nr:hypothetical protein GCM10010330_76580 [Streptomyces tendae]